MRGQTEMIGLLFIALLIVIGLLLIRPAQEIEIEQTNTQVIEVLLSTDSICDGHVVKISDSVRTCGVDCDCAEVALSKYLDRMFSAYTFVIEKEGETQIELKKGACELKERTAIPETTGLYARFGGC